MYIDLLTDEAWEELAAVQQVPPGDPQDLSWFYDLVQPWGGGEKIIHYFAKWL